MTRCSSAAGLSVAVAVWVIGLLHAGCTAAPTARPVETSDAADHAWRSVIDPAEPDPAAPRDIEESPSSELAAAVLAMPAAVAMLGLDQGNAAVAEPSPIEAADAPTVDDPQAGCTADIAALPTARGETERDRRRLEDGAVLVADKSARRLMLFEHGILKGCWRVALGFEPEGHKEIEGDGRTPEGWYRTSDKPWSSFDGAIAIHYPATRDAQQARDDGRIGRRTAQAISQAQRMGRVPPQRTAMGGAVLIHGGGSSADWTLGCIALEDADLADLRERLPKGMRTHLMIVA